MGNHLSIRTACHDNGEAIALLARELDQGDLVLEATEPVDAGAWIAFEVLLGDGQLFLEGMGRCLESRAAAGRRRVRLGELQLDAAGELLFERIQIARDDLEHGGRHTAMLIELPELSEERTTIGVTLRDSYEDIPPPSPSLGLGRAFSAPPLARPRTASPPPLPRAESAPAESAPKVTSSSPPPLPAGRSASLAPSPKAPIAPTPSSAPPSSTAPSAASQARSARPAASPSARPALPRRREVVDLATDMMQAGPRPTPARRPASSRRDEELATDETKAVVAPSARAERPAPPRKGVPSGAASPTGPVSTRRGGASIATAPAEAPGRTASSRGGVAPSAPAPATAAPSAPSPALATTASTRGDTPRRAAPRRRRAQAAAPFAAPAPEPLAAIATTAEPLAAITPEPVAAITWTSEPLAATPAPASLVAPPAAASAPLAAAPSAAASGGGVSMTFGVASDEAFDAVTRFLENPPPAEARRPSTPPPEEQRAQREVASPRETSEETRIDTRSPRELELSGLIERRVKALLPRLLAEGRVRTSAELQLLALRLGLDALETMFPED